jgi:adenylate cyclase
MGGTVNLASRLEGANKVYGSRCLISESTASAVSDAIELREIDRVIVVGQTQAQTVFEIIGTKDALSSEQIRLREHYAEGLAAYRARQWDSALGAFTAALEAMPGDGPALALIARIEALQQNPPPGDWDGAWRLERK